MAERYSSRTHRGQASPVVWQRGSEPVVEPNLSDTRPVGKAPFPSILHGGLHLLLTIHVQGLRADGPISVGGARRALIANAKPSSLLFLQPRGVRPHFLLTTQAHALTAEPQCQQPGLLLYCVWAGRDLPTPVRWSLIALSGTPVLDRGSADLSPPRISAPPSLFYSPPLVYKTHGHFLVMDWRYGGGADPQKSAEAWLVSHHKQRPSLTLVRPNVVDTLVWWSKRRFSDGS